MKSFIVGFTSAGSVALAIGSSVTGLATLAALAVGYALTSAYMALACRRIFDGWSWL